MRDGMEALNAFP